MVHSTHTLGNQVWKYPVLEADSLTSTWAYMVNWIRSPLETTLLLSVRALEPWKTVFNPLFCYGQ